jgi:hypothetical protein
LGVCNTPVIVNNEMFMYYTAITTTHGGAMPEKKVSIARASWPKDRWVSLDAAAEGSVETVCLKPSGNQLVVNADASGGVLRVEVCDENGSILPGYSFEDCRPMTVDRLEHRMAWKEHETLPTDRPIRLRFHLNHASLFAYTITPNTTD